MLPTLAEVLALPALDNGAPVVRTGADRLDVPVRWVHVAEVPWIADLLEGGELILTTGIALPRAPRDLHRYIEQLHGVGVCGVVVELGRRYRTLPAGLVDAAAEAGLPLVELHREARFVAITQEVHTVILDARVRELVAADERQAHLTLLTLLALSGDVPPDTEARANALSVPLAGRAVTGVAVRAAGSPQDPALLRDLANAAADTLRAHKVPALVAPLDDERLVMVLTGDAKDAQAPSPRVLPALAEHLHAVAGQRRARVRADVVIGTGATLVGTDRTQATLREAMRVADTAASLPPSTGWFETSDLHLNGLVYALRDSEQLAEYVRREVGALLAHDTAHGSQLYDFLAAYCRAGANKTRTAAELFISRAALYDRLTRIERVLGVDLADPEVVLALHFAVLARDAMHQPALAVRNTRHEK